MKTIDVIPLYRHVTGFDGLSSLLDSALSADNTELGSAPYNIEKTNENSYTVSLVAAGFAEDELDISVERGVLTVRGEKKVDEMPKYIYQGIANRALERRFSLAEHVEVIGARLEHGLLMLDLVKNIPEAMKARTIPINASNNVIAHDAEQQAIKAA